MANGELPFARRSVPLSVGALLGGAAPGPDPGAWADAKRASVALSVALGGRNVDLLGDGRGGFLLRVPGEVPPTLPPEFFYRGFRVVCLWRLSPGGGATIGAGDQPTDLWPVMTWSVARDHLEDVNNRFSTTDDLLTKAYNQKKIGRDVFDGWSDLLRRWSAFYLEHHDSVTELQPGYIWTQTDQYNAERLAYDQKAREAGVTNAPAEPPPIPPPKGASLPDVTGGIGKGALALGGLLVVGTLGILLVKSR